jgi:hypothetical protein
LLAAERDFIHHLGHYAARREPAMCFASRAGRMRARNETGAELLIEDSQ